MLAAEGADPERVALHLLRTDPAAAPETVAVLRAAAERARARGAPESAATFLRRALAEPPLEPAIAADVRLELGLALAAHVQPDARRPAARGGGARARRPASGSRSRSAAAARWGWPATSTDALDLCRRGLEHATDVAPEPSRGSRPSSSATRGCTPDAMPEARARLPARPSRRRR